MSHAYIFRRDIFSKCRIFLRMIVLYFFDVEFAGCNTSDPPGQILVNSKRCFGGLTMNQEVKKMILLK